MKENLIQRIHLDNIRSISYDAAGTYFKITVSKRIYNFTVTKIIEDEAHVATVGTVRYLIYVKDDEGQESIWKSISESKGVVVEQFI